jgi:hypothetical protein
MPGRANISHSDAELLRTPHRAHRANKPSLRYRLRGAGHRPQGVGQTAGAKKGVRTLVDADALICGLLGWG